MKPEEIRALKVPFIEFAAALETELEKNRETDRARQGALAKLFAQLIDVKQQWKQTDFIPDANSTLRLTFGHIRGYAPNDAVELEPITTLAGVYQKSLTGNEDFKAPSRFNGARNTAARLRWIFATFCGWSKNSRARIFCCRNWA